MARQTKAQKEAEKALMEAEKTKADSRLAHDPPTPPEIIGLFWK